MGSIRETKQIGNFVRFRLTYLLVFISVIDFIIILNLSSILEFLVIIILLT